jgi:hypothetical protein
LLANLWLHSFAEQATLPKPTVLFTELRSVQVWNLYGVTELRSASKGQPRRFYQPKQKRRFCSGSFCKASQKRRFCSGSLSLLGLQIEGLQIEDLQP